MLPDSNIAVKIKTQFPSALLIAKEDIEIMFDCFCVDDDEQKSLVISLDMYDRNPLQNFLLYNKEPKKITKYFIINENVDEIYSAFRKYNLQMQII